MKRVINIDWLEIFCLERGEKDAEYFQRKGYKVKVRDYGTPQYREMFTIYENNLPFIEVRRNPYSLRKEGGIFEVGACHVRLSNRILYMTNPIDRLRQFLCAHGYEYKAISRIDICCDFNEFDQHQDVQQFIQQYMSGEISKVNQSQLSAHGSDLWSGRHFNSLRWGTNRSPNSTKLYNKSQELREQGEKKPYIREMWADAGLDAQRDVWRIEFSLTSQFQTIENKKTGEIVKKELSDYDTPERLMYQYFSLHARYFDFRKVRYTSTGALVRKYDCPKITTLKYSPEDAPYICKRNPTKEPSPTRTLKILANKLDEIRKDKHEQDVYRNAADTLISWFLFKHNTKYNQVKEDKLKAYRQTMESIRKFDEPDKFTLKLEPRMISIAEAQHEYKQYKERQKFIYEQNEREERATMYRLMSKYGIAKPEEPCLWEQIDAASYQQYCREVDEYIKEHGMPF